MCNFLCSYTNFIKKKECVMNAKRNYFLRFILLGVSITGSCQAMREESKQPEEFIKIKSISDLEEEILIKYRDEMKEMSKMEKELFVARRAVLHFETQVYTLGNELRKLRMFKWSEQQKIKQRQEKIKLSAINKQEAAKLWMRERRNATDAQYKIAFEKLPEDVFKMYVRQEYQSFKRENIDHIDIVALMNAINSPNGKIMLRGNFPIPIKVIIDLLVVKNFDHPITELDIVNSQLRGEIPESIGDLTQLTYLKLNNNQLSGE